MPSCDVYVQCVIGAFAEGGASVDVLTEMYAEVGTGNHGQPRVRRCARSGVRVYTGVTAAEEWKETEVWGLRRGAEDAGGECEHGSYPMYDPTLIYLYKCATMGIENCKAL